ncbi:MAG: hypothetical protein IRY85_10080 [Micromonosporaceae bacterium]|nr:hypothetical protein [Micromonosporaceae bacterium]
MPWVRFDDRYPVNRKVGGLSDAAFRLHTEAIFWCARELTDGRIARDELKLVSGIARPDRHVPELVRRGLWDETDDGWQIHDYLDYQPSRAKVLADRERKAAAGRKGGIVSGQVRRGAKAKTKQRASRLVEPPNPLPSSKEGSGRGPAEPGPAAPEHHPYVAARFGECATCGLPAGNRRHLRVVEGGAA